MNPFDKLMALGLSRTKKILGQKLTIGAVVDVEATSVSPTEREERADERTFNRFWVDTGKIVVASVDWPANTPDPRTGEIIVLADGRRFRVERVTRANSNLCVSFVSLY